MSNGLSPGFGVVKLVQLQPDGLIVDGPGPGPTTSVYDASRRVVVDRLQISPRGIEATLPGGESVLDIHHLDHPGKAYDDDDLACVGFSGHYEAMRGDFGEHMVEGIAGENIIIECEGEVWLDDLGETLTIENQDTGELATFKSARIAAPCVEFSRFCAQRSDDEVSAAELGEILRFLGRGRRGFLLVLDESHDMVTVRVGDKVFLRGNGG
ncbi:MAG: hypothetical protein GY773_16590 [Actinomycetia bacterium]|nr:hypothetical protein [Actinomycetes bacterium]